MCINSRCSSFICEWQKNFLQEIQNARCWIVSNGAPFAYRMMSSCMGIRIHHSDRVHRSIHRNHHILHSRLDHHSSHIHMTMRLSSLDLQRRLLPIVLILDWLLVDVERAQWVWAVVHQLEWLPHRQRWQRRRQS